MFQIYMFTIVRPFQKMPLQAWFFESLIFHQRKKTIPRELKLGAPLPTRPKWQTPEDTCPSLMEIQGCQRFGWEIILPGSTWVVPFLSNGGNEGLVRNTLLNMYWSWWSLLLGGGSTQRITYQKISSVLDMWMKKHFTALLRTMDNWDPKAPTELVKAGRNQRFQGAAPGKPEPQDPAGTKRFNLVKTT